MWFLFVVNSWLFSNLLYIYALQNILSGLQYTSFMCFFAIYLGAYEQWIHTACCSSLITISFFSLSFSWLRRKRKYRTYNTLCDVCDFGFFKNKVSKVASLCKTSTVIYYNNQNFHKHKHIHTVSLEIKKTTRTIVLFL